MSEKKKMSKGEKIVLAGYLSIAAATFGFVGVASYGLTDEEGARDILENDVNLQNIEITGKADYWDCIGTSLFRTAFTAESHGKKVEGAVCDTFLRPASVRFAKAPPKKPGV